MARAAIQNKLKRQPSGMPDSWKRGKTNDNNLSKAQSIRREDDVGGVLESTSNLSTGSTNILQDDSQVGKNADNEVNPQVPESTPTNREIGSEVIEVSNGTTTASKSFQLNQPRAGERTAENCNN